MLDRIPERLRQSAESVAKATQFMAERKSGRNRAAGDEGSCYQGVKVEQTAEWQGAALIEKFEAALEQIRCVCIDNAPRSCDKEMALNFVRSVVEDTLRKGSAPTPTDARQ